MRELSDDTIIAMLQGGGDAERAFRALMGRYQEKLYWHVRRMVFDHEDANDVVQNTFLKVFRNVNKFQGKSKLYTWMYRIATNEAITFLDKKKRKGFAPLDNDEFDISNRLQADSYFDGDALQSKLQEALGRLPDKQRAVFNLRYFDEMSYKEMSDVMDTSVGALKASYHHAVKKIEKYFRSVEI